MMKKNSYVISGGLVMVEEEEHPLLFPFLDHRLFIRFKMPTDMWRIRGRFRRRSR